MMAKTRRALGIGARKTSELNEKVAFAADGFPIDPLLQQRARHAACGYVALALYYACVSPFVLRYMRWSSLESLLQDLSARSVVLITLLAYIVANTVLAAAAWRIMRMRRSTSWLVVALAGVFTTWTCGSLGWSIWKAWLAPLPIDEVQLAVRLSLLLAYGICFTILWRATNAFNDRRTQAVHKFRSGIG